MNQNYILLKEVFVSSFKTVFKPQKISFFVLFFLFFNSIGATAQVTTNSGSGLAPTYPDLATAITALNAATITSPVIITLTGSETAPAGGYAITASGTAVNTISVKGVTSTITANAALVAGTLTDAIFKIIGGDYITIDGFTMTENAANTTIAAGTNNMTEWGVAILNASVTDGCQNVAIKGNTIDLDRTYLNTFGIYCNTNHTALDPLTAVAATTVAGNDSGLTITGNTVTDVNNGIVVIGASTADMENDGLVIGGSLANANTITNFGTANGFSGFANVSGTTQGILMRFIKNYNVSYNTITSSASGPSLGTTRGIYNAAGTVLLGTIVNNINFNTISVKSAVAAGAIGGIFVEGAASNATTTININNNTLNGIFHTVVTTSAGNITAISNTSLAKSINIKDNTISNIENTVVALGTILGISNNPATAVNDSSLDITGNAFSNILNTPIITTAPVSLISSSIIPAKITNINNNLFNNLAVNSSVAFTFITSSLTMPAGGSQTVNGNEIVTAFNKTGGAGNLLLFTTTASSPTGTTSSNQNNNFSNITVNGTSGISGWINRDGASVTSGPVKTISNNTFSNWATATGSIVALTENAGAAGSVVSNNTISTMAAANTVTGISVLQNTNATFESNTISALSVSTANGLTGISLSGASTGNSVKLLRNKIFNLNNTFTGANPVVSGILMGYTGTPVTGDITIANNLIGDIKTPNSTTADAIRGINITATTTTFPIKVYNNSIYLNATSAGANFGTTGIFHTYNVTATTAALDLRNNIVTNTSTANGTGKTVAFRRSAATDLNNYASTSNNNLFYAGVPGVSNLIYSDGTNFDQTIADFKTRVTARETASISLNPSFTSTAGSNSGFLHIDPAVVTAIDGGGQVISTITTDFDGDTRNATTPDIGADEFISTVCTTAAPTGNATQIFCNAGTVAGLTATGTDVKWYADATGGMALATTTALANGIHYYASQTISGCESASRLDVTATVNTTAAPTGNATQIFCNAGTVAGLTASGTDVKWYADATGGMALATTTALANGIHYYASQTILGCESASRLDVTATVNTTAAPTGNATQIFCNAGTVAGLTASGTDVKWYADATGGMALATTTALANGIHYYASQTILGCESASRLDVTATVNTTAAPTGNATQTFCNAGTVASLTASGTDLKWYADATGGMALATTTALANGIHYYASQTILGCESASRLDVTATVNTTTAPTGNATQIFCNAGTVAGLTAIGTDLKWYADATGGMALATTTALANGIHYYASQTISGCESASRLDVTATVNTTAAPTGNATQIFCNAGTVVGLTASGTDVKWYADATGGMALATTTALANGIHYYASQTILGCESASRLDVTATVNTTAAPTGNATQTFVEGQTIADVVVAGMGILWYASASDAVTATNPLPTTTVLVSGTSYYATQTISGCVSTTSLMVTVSVTLGFADFDAKSFRFYPTLVKDNLNISYSEPLTEVAVFDSNGKQLIAQKVNATATQIELSHLPVGIYFVKVATDKASKTIKVIKQQ